MLLEQYPYKVAAIYADVASANLAVSMLEHSGLGDARIIRLRPGQPGVDSGVLMAGAATAFAPALFVSAPVVAPLIILGYGSLIGGTAGAVHGVRLRESALAGLVKDTLKAGYHVVLVHSTNQLIRARAQAVIGETMAENIAHA